MGSKAAEQNKKLIIAGDMNFGQNSREQGFFFDPSTQKQHPFFDCWEKTHIGSDSNGAQKEAISNEEQNTTFDREFVDNGRIDRVFATGLKPVMCDIIGKHITSVEDMPSDHYGLLVE